MFSVASIWTETKYCKNVITNNFLYVKWEMMNDAFLKNILALTGALRRTTINCNSLDLQFLYCSYLFILPRRKGLSIVFYLFAKHLISRQAVI